MQNKHGNSLISTLLAFSIFMMAVICLMGAYNQSLRKSSLTISKTNEEVVDETELAAFH